MSYTETAELLKQSLPGDALEELMPPGDDKPPLQIICMENVEIEPVDWLWRPYIPLGKITILQGDPGLGKTFLGTRIAAIVSKGGVFPAGDSTQGIAAGSVLFQTAEDGLGDTIKARLVDAGADCSRVFVIDESNDSLTLDDSRLREALAQLRPKLVVIDPLQAYIGADKDMHRANEIRPVMARLGAMAAEFKCAIVLIGHQNKAAGGKSIYRGLGSIDIAAAARSVLAVGEVPNQSTRRAIVQIKSSLAPAGQTILFDLDPVHGFLWAGTSDLTADDVLNYRSPTEREAPARSEAEDFLNELLADGEMKQVDIMAEAKDYGISEKTLRRAREKLCIICRKGRGEYRGWFWQLPQLAHPKTHGQDGQDGQDGQVNLKDAHVAQDAHVVECGQVTQIALQGEI